MDQPVTLPFARDLAKQFRDVATALEDAVRVLAEAKSASGRVAEATSALTAIRDEAEVLRRAKEAIVVEMDAERAAARADLEAWAVAERARVQATLESDRATLEHLRIEHDRVRVAAGEAQQALREARQAFAVEREQWETEREAARRVYDDQIEAARRDLEALTERTDVKRAEYRDLLARIQAVLRD